MTTNPKIEKQSPEREALMRAQELAHVESYGAGDTLPKDFQERVKRLRRDLVACFADDAARALKGVLNTQTPAVVLEAEGKGASLASLLWPALAIAVFGWAWLLGLDTWIVQRHGASDLTISMLQYISAFVIGFSLAMFLGGLRESGFAIRVRAAFLEMEHSRFISLSKTVALMESPEWREYMRLVATMGNSSLLSPDDFSEACVRRHLVSLAKAKIRAEQAYDGYTVETIGRQLKEAFENFRLVGILGRLTVREVFMEAERELKSEFTAAAERASGKPQ